MVLSFNTYTTQNDLFKDIFREIRTDYYEADYTEDDKLNVVMHRVIDNFVSFISINDLKNYLNMFEYEDMKCVERGMLPEMAENPEKYDRALLFCLIEQAMFNREIEKKIV